MGANLHQKQLTRVQLAPELAERVWESRDIDFIAFDFEGNVDEDRSIHNLADKYITRGVNFGEIVRPEIGTVDHLYTVGPMYIASVLEKYAQLDTEFKWRTSSKETHIMGWLSILPFNRA